MSENHDIHHSPFTIHHFFCTDVGQGFYLYLEMVSGEG